MKSPVPGHTAGKWKSQDLNPVLLLPRATALTLTISQAGQKGSEMNVSPETWIGLVYCDPPVASLQNLANSALKHGRVVLPEELQAI